MFPRKSGKGSGRHRSLTCLTHLDLGDVGSPRDMVVSDSSRARAIVHALQKHDFAFVVRSDGSWTYAIVAERKEATLRFVVDRRGATKELSRRRWSESVRLVNNAYNLERIIDAEPLPMPPSHSSPEKEDVRIDASQSAERSKSLPGNILQGKKDEERGGGESSFLPPPPRRHGKRQQRPSVLSLFP